MALKPYDGDYDPIEPATEPAPHRLKPYSGDYDPLPGTTAPARTNRTLGEAASDLGVSVVEGTGQLLGGTAELANVLTGGLLDKGVRKAQGALDRALGGPGGDGPGITGAYQGLQDEIDTEKSPVLRRKEQELADTKGLFASAGKVITDPTLLVSEVAKQAPNLALLGGGAAPTLARGLESAVARGLTGKAASAAARRSLERQLVGTAAIQEAGPAALQVRMELAALPESVWQANPEFQQRVAAGEPAEDVKASMAQWAATKAAGIGAAAGAVGGRLTAGLEGRIFTRSLERGGISDLARGTATAIGKEAAEEAIQEGGSQVGSNVGVRDVDPTRGLMAGVPEAAGTGAALGAVIGGGMNVVGTAVSPRRTLEQQPQMEPAPAGVEPAPQEMLALPAPVIQVRPDGKAASESTVYSREQARAARDVDFAARRQELGLTPDVNAARAQHPAAALNLPNGSPLPDPSNGPLSRVVNAAAGTGVLEQAAAASARAAQIEADAAAGKAGKKSGRRDESGWNRQLAASAAETVSDPAAELAPAPVEPGTAAPDAQMAPMARPGETIDPETGEISSLEPAQIKAYLLGQAERGEIPKVEVIVKAFGLKPRQASELRREVVIQHNASLKAATETRPDELSTGRTEPERAAGAGGMADSGSAGAPADGEGAAAGAAPRDGGQDPGAAATAPAQPGAEVGGAPAGPLTYEDSAELQDDDITPASGGPFTIADAARRVAERTEGGRVFPVDGGFVVRTPNPSRSTDAGAESTPRGDARTGTSTGPTTAHPIALPSPPVAADEASATAAEQSTPPLSSTSTRQAGEPAGVGAVVGPDSSASPQSTPTPSPLEALPADADGFVKTRDLYGKTVRVRKADIDMGRALLPLYDAKGQRKPGQQQIVHRDNIDIDGSKARAMPGLPYYAVTTRSGERPFKTEKAAKVAVERAGQRLDNYEIRSRGGGFIAVRKAKAVPVTSPNGISGATDNASIIKTALDSSFGDSKQRRDISKAPAGSVQIRDLIASHGEHVVLSHVRTALNDQKVLRAVVEAVPVDVVNRLIGREGAAQYLLHDKTVLTHRLTVARDVAVPKPVLAFLDALAAAVDGRAAGSVAEESRLPGVGSLSTEGRSTTGAGSKRGQDARPTAEVPGRSGAGATRSSAEGASAGGTSQAQDGHVEFTLAGQTDTVNVGASDAQKETGVYKKGHVRVIGLDVSIENPAGSRRRPEWPPLVDHYGYFKGTVGKDKDHVDVFMTDQAEDESLPVFVVDQNNADGSFDEHKVILGAADEASARATYLRNYSKGWKGLGGITQMLQDEFKAWVKDPAKTKRRATAAKRGEFTSALARIVRQTDGIRALRHEAGLSVADATRAWDAIDRAGLKEGTRHRAAVLDAIAQAKAAKAASAERRRTIDAGFEANRKALVDLKLRKGDTVSFNADGRTFTGEVLSLGDKEQAVVAVGVKNDRGVADYHVGARKLTKGAPAETVPPPDAEAGAAASVQAVEEPAAAPRASTDKIEDFGEKLEGARKFLPPALQQEVSETDIAALPLSKVWPSDAHEAIEDPTAAALAFAARQEVPAKPRKAHRISQWVDTVKQFRALLAGIAEKPLDELEAFAEKKGSTSLLQSFFPKVRLLAQLPREMWGRVEKVGEYPSARRAKSDEALKAEGIERVFTPNVGSSYFRTDPATGDRSTISLLNGEIDVLYEMRPFSAVTIDGTTHHFDVPALGPDEVQKIKELLGAAKPVKGGLTSAAFDIRKKRSGEVFINRKGDKDYRPLQTFAGEDAVKQAREYLQAHVAELEQAWERVKARDNVGKGDVRRDQNQGRVGANRRDGKDVTADMFAQAFGFRGVQFGNWVGQGAGAKDRQGLLNEAYDALLDLADLLGLPTRAISLEGSLGLALGARGGGKNGAHFEPGNLVINLTKTRGAGSLAHEWFHALDNYFARKRGGEVAFTGNQQHYREHNYITYKPEPMLLSKQGFGTMTKAEVQRRHEQHPTSRAYLMENWGPSPNHKEGVRPVVEKTFAELVAALNASPMATRAAAIDAVKTRGGIIAGDGYWSRIIERGARSFESYILTKLAQRGWSNDFLVNIRTWEQWQQTGKNTERYPYLRPDEEGPIVEAFDNLFATIEHHETEGRIRLSSAAPAASQKGIASGTLRASVDRAVAGWRGDAPKVVVLADASTAPNPTDEGYYDPATGTVYLVAPNLPNWQRAQQVLAHESIGHYGVEAITGPQLWGQITDTVQRMRSSGKHAALFAEIGRRYRGVNDSIFVREAVAVMAEKGVRNSVIDRLVAAFRRFVRQVLRLDVRYTEEELRQHIVAAARYVRDGVRPRAAVATRSPAEALTEAFASRPERDLNKTVPVVGVAGGLFGDTARDLTRARARARTYLTRLRDSGRTMSNDDTGWKIALSGKSIGELVNFGAEKLNLLAALPRITKVAVLAHSEAPRKGLDAKGRLADKAFHMFYAPVRLNGALRIARLVVREDVNGSFAYDLQQSEVLETANPATAGIPVIESGAGQKTGSGGRGGAPTTMTVAQIRDAVNAVGRPGWLMSRPDSADVESPAFKRWFGASKVVDAAGNPLTVYHGTASEFWAFDSERLAESTGHMTAPLGFFFDQQQGKAQRYAQNAAQGVPADERVIDVYLSIQNPKWMTSGELLKIDDFEQARALRRRLLAEGHDGIQLTDNGQWITFEPMQIKSASENRGTFAPDNPNILSSRADPGGVLADIEAVMAGGSSEGLLARTRALLADATPQKIKDQLRSTWLGALTTRHLTELGADYFGNIKHYSDFLARMGADRNQLQTEGEGVAEPARKWAGKSRVQAKAMFDLMHESTIEGVDPAEAFQPLQFRYSGQLWEATPKNVKDALKAIRQQMRERSGDNKKDMMAEAKAIRGMPARDKRRRAAHPTLVAKWNSLSPQAQEIYRQFRDLYQQRSDQVEAALIDRINDTDAPDNQKRKLVAVIRQQFETARLQGVYFPLQRHGRFFVAAERDGVQTFMMFERLNQLERGVKDLRARGFTITAQGLKQEGKAKNAPSGTFVAEIIEALNKAGVSDQTQDEIYQIYLQALPEMSMRKHSIHRQSVPGFDPDAIRAFAFNMHHGAHQLARLRHGHKLQAVLDVLEKQQNAARKEAGADTRKIAAGDAILGELGRRHQWIMNPTDSQLTNLVSSAGFIYYLGLTPAAALVNLSQTALVSYPYLASRFGGAKAMNALLAGMRDSGRTLGHIQKTLTDPEELRAHRVLQAMGALDKTQAHNLAGIAEGGLQGYNPAWARAMEIIGWGFHKTEVVNREATGIAAFRLAKAAGQSFDEAVRTAADTINDTHFDYTNANRARFMQNGAAKTLLMFRQYSLNMTWHLARMVWKATKGESAEVKSLARSNLAGVLGMTALFSGTLGLPLVSVAMGVLNSVAASFGDDDEPWDAETELRAFLVSMLGPEAETLLTGAGNRLTGADIASRVSMSQLWFRDADRELDGRGAYYHLLEQAAGPMGGVLKNALVGKSLIDEGHLMRGVETMLPKSLKDMVKATRYATQGANNLRGDPLVEDVSLWQTLLQLNGFTPSAVAGQYDENRALKNYERYILDRRRYLMDGFAMALRLGDGEGRAEVLEKIRAFNATNPEIAITPKSIRASIDSRLRYTARAEGGIVLNQKIAGRVREAVGVE